MKEKVKGNLKRYFLAGLISVLPIFATVYVIKFVFDIAVSSIEKILPVQRIITALLHTYVDSYIQIESIDNIVKIVSIILSFIIIFVGIYLIGVWINHFINKERIKYFENIFLKLPLAKPIYTTFKQLSVIIFSNEYKSYKKVVLVEYPRKGIYSLGFLTKNENRIIENIVGEQRIYNIFIPTSPNPTSGMFIMLPADEVRELDLKVEEAFKMIISGGAIIPAEKAIGGINADKEVE